MAQEAPYGTWPSPLGLDELVAGAVSVSFPLVTGRYLYWIEQRPHEQGRQVLVRAELQREALVSPASGRPSDPAAAGGMAGIAGGGMAGTAAGGMAGTAAQEWLGQPAEVVGPGVGVRSAVHEYGGLAYTVHDETIYIVDAADQRIYRLGPDGERQPITPEPPRPRSVRHGLPVVTPDGRFVLAIRERHEGDRVEDVVNEVVVVPADGSASPRVVAGGHDFYGHIVVSPDGRRLAWVQWDHPDMPWDASELWEGDLDGSGAVVSARRIAGGDGEAVSQPRYAPDGRLTFLSDRTGWSNLYQVVGDEVVALAPIDADIGEPDWVLGTSSYAVLGDGTVVATWTEGGMGRLGWWVPGADRLAVQATPYVRFSQVRVAGDGRSAVAVAGTPTEPMGIVGIVPVGPSAASQGPIGPTGAPQGLLVRPLYRSTRATLPPDAVSVAEPIVVPTGQGEQVHALFYAPCHPDRVAPPEERPPLVVRCHGGPTAAASPVYHDAVQFWTSRGFAVVDVDYGGSSGYGRRYRERLAGRWGVVDVADCVDTARHLVATGRVDGARMVVQGSSAGGFTVLCAAVFHDAFAAGASLYGIGDVAALARDTHKFEAHYVDRLIGPWPEAAATYRERSPLFHLDRLQTPLILFQGLDDPVVPPSQTQAMVAALDANRVPHAALFYEGEQHGFRRAEHIRRTVEAQLTFVGEVLRITPADDLAPLDIRHRDQLEVLAARRRAAGTLRPTPADGGAGGPGQGHAP